MKANLKLGIKKKIMIVLAGSLVLTTALHVLLASYFTDQQNQEAAFVGLERDLFAWGNELQDSTLHLREGALAVVSDTVILNQLAELIDLQFALEDTADMRGSWETARTLSYIKSVAINRLQLVLRTSGFSSVAVYTDGKLSHYVSVSEVGMMALRQENAQPVWLRNSTDNNGRLPLQSWPSWEEGRPRPVLTQPELKQPTVSFAFPDPENSIIQIAIPVQGFLDERFTDSDNEQLKSRFVTDLSIAGSTNSSSPPNRPIKLPVVVGVLVFRKLIDRSVLEKVADETGKLPVLLSPDGHHRQQLSDLNFISDDFLKRTQRLSPNTLDPVLRQTVAITDRGSFYTALRPWVFEGQPGAILGLASSRDTTLENIRQTVSAILAMTGLILLLSLGVGGFLVGRLINPVVALTAAVKDIGLKSRSGTAAMVPVGQAALQNLHPILIKAPDEIGDLANAFNMMIAELRQTLETLELRVQARTAELRQQKRYLRTLIDTLPLLAWFKDTESRYLAANQVLAKACGRTPEEMVGLSDLVLWPPDLAESYRADDVEVMRSRQRKTLEESVVNEKGTFWVETEKAPVVDDDGTVLGTVGIARDISARKATEAAREAALAEAERLARVRSEFLAQMSHELRTPLNGILGYAQILQRDKTLSERQLTGLGVIQQSGEHLLTLINDILDFAKVEAGKLQLFPTNIPLAPFLRVIANIISVKAEQKDLIFVVETPPDLPEGIHADEKRLRQVLLNLLSNAVKFTEHGQVTLRLRRSSPSRLRFDVEDTGVGIGVDQLKRLFQPFEQVGDAQQRAGGTGLGLAISRQLVRMMGDDIRVESQLGQGSTFWFELETPVVSVSESVPPTPEGIVDGYAGPRKRVLVVDDLLENRAVMVAMLEPLGFDLVEAVNGREALEKARAVRPDLILMDVVMPEMGGLEATRLIRGSPDLKDVPIIAISASASDADTKNCLVAGVNAFLPKPIVMARLLELIGPLLKITWTYVAAPEVCVPALGDTVPLVAPPRPEMEVLHRLARRGRMHDIIEWADHAVGLDARHQPFVNRLRVLAKAYQSKAILGFVEQHMKEKE